MPQRFIMALLVLVTINAQALTGKIVDDKGNPISNAMIKVAGQHKSILTDGSGQFVLDGDNFHELHITAPGYSHKVIHFDDSQQGELNITLARSVIEQIDVVGMPIHASVIESAQPIAVLRGEELRNRQAATLGDTLENEVGVHTNFHANVASTPVIRGLSGPRVLITQNSLDVSDVSRVGPDHSVASEVSVAEQVEILRGPATLFFGSGAIGGVVNVVDQRVPASAETFNEWLVSYDTVNEQKLMSGNLNTAFGNVALHLDGFWREADDYKVPVAPELNPEAEHSNDDTVANSGEESSGYTLGASYLLDNGYVGISAGRLDREYGIPGHSHGEEGHEDDGHDHGEEAHADTENVYADLEQDRYQLISELSFDNDYLRGVNTRIGFTDYTHAEIERGIVGTEFNNETVELRVDVLHQSFAEWQGGFVFHYKNSDVSAVGEEAFTPPSESETFALALMEERHFGDVLIQAGARVEQVTITADDVLLPSLSVHSHDGEDDHDHEEAGATRVFAADQEFTPVSLSVGAVWDFSPGYNVATSISRSQRAPSASELLSFGPHIGTRSYEVGALFALHQEGDEAHFELNSEPLDLETSTNIDLTFRKHEGDVGIILNAFYNEVDNYYYQNATGYYAESVHNHGDEADEEDIHADELPVYLFTNEDAKFYGFEAQGIWQVSPSFKTTLFSDYVRAQLKDGGDLPRTPPLRYGARFDYQWQQFSAYLSWSHYDEQHHLADYETPTDSYDWFDATFTYNLPVNSFDLAFYLKVENLTDTEARVHTSFLKDIAPKPARNFSLGMRGSF